jgi:hypothetical protein
VRSGGIETKLRIRDVGTARGASRHDQRHLVAVRTRFGHPHGHAHVGIGNSAETPQGVRHDVALPAQLRRVGEMLHLATAAGSEDAAKRLDALGRRCQKFDEVRNRVLRFDRFDPYPRTLARNRAEHVDDHAVRTADGLARLRNEVGAIDIDDVPGRELRGERETFGSSQAFSHRAL